jgi:hypothetical protein
MYCGHTCVSVTLEPKSVETIVLILCIQFSIQNFEPVPYNICELCASSTVCILDAVQKPNSWTYNFVEFSDLWFPYTMFTLQTSFKPLLRGEWDPLVEVTVNSKEENFSPNYDKEFSLWRNSTLDSRHSPSHTWSLISAAHFVLNMYKIRNYVACRPCRSTLVRIYDPAL